MPRNPAEWDPGDAPFYAIALRGGIHREVFETLGDAREWLSLPLRTVYEKACLWGIYDGEERVGEIGEMRVLPYAKPR